MDDDYHPPPPPPPPPQLGPRSAISLPDTVHARSLLVAPADRQRTIQACDKCRERKTKCSGKHPVCHRCKMRGLICQYSSREPRSRGPTRARLRNVVSSMELTTPSNHTPPEAHIDSLPQPLRRFSSHYDDPLLEYPALDDLTSIPRSFQSDSEHYSVSPTRATFETPHETLTQQPIYNNQTIPSYMPSNQINRTHQWRDVRRVQSHSALIAPTTSNMDGIKYQNVNPLVDNPSEPTSYKQWPTQGYPVPSPPVMFDTFAQFAPSSAPVELQTTFYHSPRYHTWNYHSDGGSTSSEPMSSGEPVLEYSPSSSDDVSEPSLRTSSIGFVPNPDTHQHTHMGHNLSEYVPYQEFDYGNNYWALPSREGKFYQPQAALVQSGNLAQQGIMHSVITSDSDSSLPLGYPSTYP